jgi:hypothetical protein
MQRNRNFQLTTQGITAVLLFGMTFGAGAEQMRALPGTAPTTAVKPVGVSPATVQLPAVQLPVPGAVPKPIKGLAGAPPPLGFKLPDLAFSWVTVEKTTYLVGAVPQPLVVNNVLQSESSGAMKAPNPCNRPFTFPLQLIVKNIGQANFLPKDSSQAVGVTIGPWNSATNLSKLLVPTDSQVMDFSVTLPPGKYMLDASIDLHNGVAEARTDNNKLSWPLEVKCEVKAATMALALPHDAPSASIPTPKTMLPDIVAEGGGMQIAGKFLAASNGPPVSVWSTQMMPTASSPSACRFGGSFKLMNTGSGAAPMFDAYAKVLSEQGVTLDSTGYSIPGLAIGESYSQSFSFDLAPGTYKVVLDIDPNHKIKTKVPHQYIVHIKTNCGTAPIGGGVKQKPLPPILLN